MKLIKKLYSKRNKCNGRMLTYSLFLCPFCYKKVERQTDIGKRVKSCGCSQYLMNSLFGKKHGFKGTRIYDCWASMKRRCISDKRYVDKKIKICDQWKSNFVTFKNWAVSNGYKDNLVLDRINNDGDYIPENCRWVSDAINCRNRPSTKLTLEIAREIRKRYKEEGISQRQLAKEYNIHFASISYLLQNKTWKEEEINEQNNK